MSGELEQIAEGGAINYVDVPFDRLQIVVNRLGPSGGIISLEDLVRPAPSDSDPGDEQGGV